MIDILFALGVTYMLIFVSLWKWILLRRWLPEQHRPPLTETFDEMAAIFDWLFSPIGLTAKKFVGVFGIPSDGR